MAKNLIVEGLNKRSDEEKSPGNLTIMKKIKMNFINTNKMVGQKGSRSTIKHMAFKSQRISSNSSIDQSNKIKDTKRTNSIKPKIKEISIPSKPSRLRFIRIINQ